MKQKMRGTLRATSIPKWFEMVRETCPICNKAGACMVHENGKVVACIRVESERPFSSNSACPSWLHWLSGESKMKIDKQDIQQEVSEKKLSPAALNTVYQSLIDCTIMEDSHYDHLKSEKRQLADQQIYIRGYRSFPSQAWNRVKDISDATGITDFTGIPGFYQAKGKYGDFWNLAGSEGIMLPFRNIRNEIEGFQIRIDNPPNDVEINKRKQGLRARVIQQPNLVQVTYDGEIILEKKFSLKETVTINYDDDILGWVKLVKGKRYFWLSSANKPKGTGSGQPAPIHVSVPSKELQNWKTGEVRKTKTVWLGEGPLKQDIAVDKIVEMFEQEELEEIGTTMLGLPGVGSWRLALPILKEMGAEKVIICFDMDAVSNPYVQKHLKECAKALKAEGLTGDIALWDGEKDGVGLDDLLLQRKLPQIKRLF
ncbi:DUF3854 domain-containing protein [Rossellomorea arthrocnemi]|uniref:DUF3854 domain-containing protein n=1 Tax=Rossellomorea arthrocnemi TaxID=2769542 RepID=UPI001918ECB0|nr:DUF3854 domain-containing protein [Rossellomorea arthrocnemi]